MVTVRAPFFISTVLIGVPEPTGPAAASVGNVPFSFIANAGPHTTAPGRDKRTILTYLPLLVTSREKSGLTAVVEACATLPTDADANKRLELWLEMETCVALPADRDAATTDLLRELAAVNQDFREAVKMIRPALRPTVVFHRFGESPMSGQDIRIKRRYIM